MSVLFPLSEETVIAASVRREGLRVHNGVLYWREQRPLERGRGVVMCGDAQGPREFTLENFNVRSRVHEYGGGCFCVGDGVVFAVEDRTQNVHRISPDGSATVICDGGPLEGAWRLADPELCARSGRLFAVRERHVDAQGRPLAEPVNELVCVHLDGHVTCLDTNADFFAAPRLSADGNWLAWLRWRHPHMPWDATELCIAPVDEQGVIGAVQVIAGGELQVSVLQPLWSAEGALWFLSDQAGWWQLWSWKSGSLRCECVRPADVCGPPWSLGLQSFVLLADGRPVAIQQEQGRQHLWWRPEAEWQPLELPFTAFADSLATDGRQVFALAGSDARPENLLAIDPETAGWRDVLTAPAWDAPVVTPVHRRSASGVPFLHYPLTGQPDAPLLFLVHSGPTGHATAALNPAIQYWLSHSFEVVDINYRGSCGYGRAWRQALVGEWGRADVTDVQDVLAGFPGRTWLAKGTSAAGLTLLHLLACQTPFAAVALRYPVVDLPALEAHSHKYEKHYLSQLVGDTGSGEALIERSPLSVLTAVPCPVSVLQGDADPVVPMEQAEALRRLGGERVTFQVFSGESHGFRRADTLLTALRCERDFFKAHTG